MKSRLFLAGALVVGAAALFGVWGRAIAPRSAATRAISSTRAGNVRPAYDPEAVHRNLEFYAKQVRYDPQSAIFRSNLANWYLESYRESGDGADVLAAEKAARASLQIRSRNNDAAYFQLSRALVAMHRFPEALQAARQAARYDRAALRQCADIEVETGDYLAARRDLALSPFQENDPAYLALQARLTEIGGDNAGALGLVQRAATEADANPEVPPQTVAWFFERLGRLQFQNGRPDDAQISYRHALKAFPRDYRVMAALARLSAARGEWQNCLKWGDKAAEIVPAPDTIELLGDAHAALNQKAAAAQNYRLVETMGRLARAQGAVYDRQLALFYANRRQNLPLALRLARGELKQRRDIYAYDAIAWINLQMGQLPAAQSASDQALKWKTGDALLWYHAGLIADARGQKARAKTDLARALKLNPYFATPLEQGRARQILARLS